MIDEEIRLLEREAATGDKAKVFDLARLRGRFGLGPKVGRLDLRNRELVDHELFDTERVRPPRSTSFFERASTFANGDPKTFGAHANFHGSSGNYMPYGYAMAVTEIRLLLLGTDLSAIQSREHLASIGAFRDMAMTLEGWVHLHVGPHHEGLSWRARDVANGIRLDGPLVLEELVLFRAEWTAYESAPDRATVDGASIFVRLSLIGVMAKPPG